MYADIDIFPATVIAPEASINVWKFRSNRRNYHGLLFSNNYVLNSYISDVSDAAFLHNLIFM